MMNLQVSYEEVLITFMYIITEPLIVLLITATNNSPLKINKTDKKRQRQIYI